MSCTLVVKKIPKKTKEWCFKLALRDKLYEKLRRLSLLRLLRSNNMVLWAIKSPDGELYRTSLCPTERESIIAFLRFTNWEELQLLGYRAVKVELREIGNE